MTETAQQYLVHSDGHVFESSTAHDDDVCGRRARDYARDVVEGSERLGQSQQNDGRLRK